MVEFEWDEEKNRSNQEKHQVAFEEAQNVFLDAHRLIIEDLDHSNTEERFYCIGKVGESLLTVRFTLRGETIRIIGAGKWRKGRRLYEQENR
ncbi:MAG: BrnT family toxin [bacterium]|nr:BrnT family toxin [bacterium]